MCAFLVAVSVSLWVWHQESAKELDFLFDAPFSVLFLLLVLGKLRLHDPAPNKSNMLENDHSFYVCMNTVGRVIAVCSHLHGGHSLVLAAFVVDKSYERVWNANPSSGIWTTSIQSSSECVSRWFLVHWWYWWLKLFLQNCSFPYIFWQACGKVSSLLCSFPEFQIIHIQSRVWSNKGRTVLKLSKLRDRRFQWSCLAHAAAPKLPTRYDRDTGG